MSRRSADILINTLSHDGYWMVNKKIASLLGNDGAIILSDLVSKYKYFKQKKMLEDDGFYNLSDNLEKDCNVSRYIRREIFQKLQDVGFLKIEKKGFSPKNYYYIQHDTILDFLHSESDEEEVFENIEETDESHKGQNLPSLGSLFTPHRGKNLPHHRGENLPHHRGHFLPHHRGENLPQQVYSNKNKEIKINKEEQSAASTPHDSSPTPSFSVLKVNSPSEIKEFARRARDTLLRKTPKTAANNSYKVEDQVMAFTEIIFGDLPYEWWKFENGKRKSQPGKVPPVAYPWDFNTTEKFDMLADLATEWLKKPKVFYEKSEWTPESYQNVVIENLRECLFNNDSYLPPNEQSEKNRKAKQELEVDKQKSQEISKALENMQKIEEAKKNGQLDPTKWTATPEELIEADRAGMSLFNMKKTAPCIEGYVFDFIDDLVAVGKAEMPDSFKYPEWVEGFMVAITDAITARSDWTWKNPECKTPLEALHAYVRQCKMDAED
jgi:hypothetical protein